MKTEDTEVLGRELNKARSKPDTVDQPVRTARIFVDHYNSTQYCKTETVLVFSIFPFLQTNITSQMWPCRGKGAVCPCVLLSVRLSHSWIMSKRINISSKFFHHRVATPF